MGVTLKEQSKKQFKMGVTITCKCGSEMHSAPGISIHGLVTTAEGYWVGANKKEAKYIGFNGQWVCPNCGKATESYVGLSTRSVEDDA